MKPQRLALCVIGGMVTLAGGIVTAVLVRDGGGSTPELERQQAASAAAPEPAAPPQLTYPEPTEPEIPEDASPPALNREPRPEGPERPNLGYTLADVEAFFKRGHRWGWGRESDDGHSFRNVAINSGLPDLEFLMAGSSESASIHFITATFEIEEQPTVSFETNLLIVTTVLSQFSDWDVGEVVDWFLKALSGLIVEGRFTDDASVICKGRHQLLMMASKTAKSTTVVIVLEALSTHEAATCPQWEPSAPVESNATLSIQVETKTVERNEEWHKVSYILTITNNTTTTMAGSATIQWLDDQGFVLADELVIAPSIAPGESIFRGYALIDVLLAAKVASTEAKVTAQ